MKKKFGLYEIWNEVLTVLSDIAPVYEDINKLISFGKDINWRYEGISKNIKSDHVVLDAGCGPGTMSNIALKLYPDLNLHLIDPLDTMIENAQNRFVNSNCIINKGRFEKIEYPDEFFDVVMCGFSLRDAYDLELSLKEINRVLKNDGKFLIIDLGKPNNVFVQSLFKLYWKYIVPFLAILKLGKKGLQYSILYKTYKKHPTNNQMKSLLSELFVDVNIIEKILGGSVIITSKKSNLSKRKK